MTSASAVLLFPAHMFAALPQQCPNTKVKAFRKRRSLRDAAVKHLAVVEDDGTDEPPPAARQFAAVHQVLQFTDLHRAFIPATHKHLFFPAFMNAPHKQLFRVSKNSSF